MLRECAECNEPTTEAQKLEDDLIRDYVLLRRRTGHDVSLADFKKLRDWHCDPCTIRIKNMVHDMEAQLRAPDEEVRDAFKNRDKWKGFPR